jgi:hypothetical protein
MSGNTAKPKSPSADQAAAYRSKAEVGAGPLRDAGRNCRERRPLRPYRMVMQPLILNPTR